MLNSEILEFLRRFNGFNGAVVLSFRVNFGTSDDDSEVIFKLKAYCDDSGSEHGWHQVVIHVRKRVIFSWVESSWDTNLVLNFPVRLIEWNDLQIIDFDPLHARQKELGLAVSEWFVGGLDVSISIEGNERSHPT